MNSRHRLAARLALAPAVLLLAWAPLRADGPPVGPLAPREAEAPADSAALRDPDLQRALGLPADQGDDGLRVSREIRGRHATLRRVALVCGVGLAAVALWRNEVADDRAKDYDRAIFPGSAAAFRESVRDAERERNVAASLAGLAFSVSLLTFVY